MRAILIDPEKKTIEEVDYDGEYKHIYELLNIETFTCIDLGEGETLYVDDNGLLNDPQFFFEWEGYAQPIAGRGLILSTNEDGDTVASEMALEEAKKRITFSQYKVEGFEEFEGTTERFGEVWPVFGHRPILRKLD